MKEINFASNQQNTLLVTFGSGTVWKSATRRLTRQARFFGRIDGIVIFDENDLAAVNPSLPKFAEIYPKGHGLWKWKPLILQEVLRLYPNIRTVIYLDAGCELNCNEMSLRRFDQYMQIVNDHGGLGFEIPHRELEWTYPGLLAHFECTKDTMQVAGGILFFQNNFETLELLAEWDYWMNVEDSKHLIGATIGHELPKNYKEHRFDQSIISLIWHKHNLPTIADETFWGPKWKRTGSAYPIWATRNRLPVSYRHNKILILAIRVFAKLIHDLRQKFNYSAKL